MTQIPWRHLKAPSLEWATFWVMPGHTLSQTVLGSRASVELGCQIFILLPGNFFPSQLLLLWKKSKWSQSSLTDECAYRSHQALNTSHSPSVQQLLAQSSESNSQETIHTHCSLGSSQPITCGRLWPPLHTISSRALLAQEKISRLDPAHTIPKGLLDISAQIRAFKYLTYTHTSVVSNWAFCCFTKLPSKTKCKDDRESLLPSLREGKRRARRSCTFVMHIFGELYNFTFARQFSDLHWQTNLIWKILHQQGWLADVICTIYLSKITRKCF